MKKFIFLFISILSISFLFFTNKSYAQEYPQVLMKHSYALAVQVGELSNTYVYLVDYSFDGVKFTSLEENEYFLVPNINIPMQKGFNEFWNSYELIAIDDEVYEPGTNVQLRVTLLKDLANSYNTPGKSIQDFFRNDSALYILYMASTGSLDYENGYNDGYEAGRNDGYNEGRDVGYNEGYDIRYNTGRNDGYNSGYNNGYINGEQAGYSRGLDDGYNNGYNIGYQLGYDEGFSISYDNGYNDGYTDGYADGFNDKFTANIHVWIIPAIIIVFAIGIFVSYRRGGSE